MDEAEAFGRDRVSARGRALVVESPADMPEWEYREHRRAMIVVRGERYFVAEKRLRPGGGYRYRLEPWEDGASVPGREIVYDAAHAIARDADARTAARRGAVEKALFFVSPLLGLLTGLLGVGNPRLEAPGALALTKAPDRGCG